MSKPSAHRRARRWCAVALAALALAPLAAHEVVVEQIVDLTLQPQGNRLAVTLHVPAAVSGDPDLPGILLAGDDAAALDARLRIVAADIVHNLDIEQDDTSLPAPQIAARRGADGASIDIDLRYPTVDDSPFSARLNAFTSTAGPARTNARFLAPSGRVDRISVTGPPSRVVFDPPLTSVLQQFAVRGVRALLDGGDQLLLIVCLLLPVRRARSTLTLFAGIAAAQAVTMTASTIAPAVTAAWLPGTGVIAASAIAIAAMQNVTNAQLRWVLAVTVVFGALNGLALGGTVASAAQFAGAHRLIAVVCFAAVVLIGELWLGALGWMVRRWFDEQGISERGIAILGSAFVAHDALHRMAARADIFAQGGSIGSDRVIEWITIAWAVAVLLVGVANALSRQPDRAAIS